MDSYEHARIVHRVSPQRRGVILPFCFAKRGAGRGERILLILEALPLTLAAVFLLVPAACTTTKVEKQAMITGTATYRQPIALPSESVIEVKLVEVHGGGNKTIAEKQFKISGSGPISFALAYNPNALHAKRQYAVEARIFAEGKPLYVTRTVNHQMRRGRIAHADIILQPAR